MEPPPLPPLPQSEWGKASLIISGVSWLVVLVPLAIWVVIAPSSEMPRAAPGEVPAGIIEWVLLKIFFGLFGGLIALILPILMIPIAVAMFSALGFGIAGLRQRGRRKTCALLGTVLSALGVVIVLALIFL